MAEFVQMIATSVLKEHPRNVEFFDNVSGEEFDRLVESIKAHGVLTPLRATKDMTLISGHQRKRAAIEAGVTEVPVIIDDSSDKDEILIKLIETNFGRMKNDPIKQAKWLDEYVKLKGIKNGGNKSDSDNQNLKLEQVARELGISVPQLCSIRSLLKLNPELQQLITDGNISATTGYKLLTKLSPEEQVKLLDKLPDDVKLSAKSVEAKIEEMRSDSVTKINEAKQENDKLLAKIDNLIREKNELLAGNFPVSEAHQQEINDLNQKYRETYEKLKSKERYADTLREQLNKAVDEMNSAKAKAKGGDSVVIDLQMEIEQLTKEKEAVERERNELEYQLTEKEDEINSLKADNKTGFVRPAVMPGGSDKEYDERMIRSFKVKITQSVNAFQDAVNEILSDINLLSAIEDDTVEALGKIAELAVQSAQKLYSAISTGTESVDEVDAGNDDWTEDDMIATGDYVSISA